MGNLWQDIRYGIRQLAAQPGFTVVAVLTLALGMGANLAIFNTLNAMLLKTLPVERPEELRLLYNGQENNTSFSNPLWEQVRDHQQGFSGVFAWSSPNFNLARGGEKRYANGLWASGQMFSTLGVRPHIGRLIAPADDSRGGQAAVAVLSYDFWQSEYGGSPDTLGKTIYIDGHPFEIIGVAQRGFFGMDVGEKFDVAVPISAEAILRGENSALDKPRWWWLRVAGRLRPGVTVDQADAQLAAISPAAFEATVSPTSREPYRSEYLQRKFTTGSASSGVSYLRRRYTQAVWVLMGMVGLILLIACANIANLLLARATARQKEMGVRLALGASRRRLVRQMLTESLLLAMAGTALAVPLASFAGRLLVAQIATSTSTTFLDLSADWRITAFVAAAALLTTLLFGLAPALRATRVSLADAMKQAGPGAGERRWRFGPGRLLVIGQVAVSMVLLAGAALLLRTFYNLASVDAGFDPGRVLIVDLDLRGAEMSKEARLLFYDQLTERLRQLPGVAKASQCDLTPISGSTWNGDIEVEGFVSKSRDDAVTLFNSVSSDYFAVMGTPFVAGRDFGPQETANSPQVAIVNEAFTRKFFPGKNPVGQQFSQTEDNKRTSTEIVGLVKDSKYQTLREEPQPTAYVPIAHKTWQDVYRSLVLRAAGDPAALIPSVRTTIEQMSPQTAMQFQTLETQLADSLTQDRLLALLSAFFGGLALLLSSVGLYGLLAHSVARRRREIGIRMALGSTPDRILRLVLSDGVLLAVIGVALGVGGAIAATRVLASFLFGVGARDPFTLSAAGLLLVAVATIACSGAARRAARIDPWSALRHE